MQLYEIKNQWITFDPFKSCLHLQKVQEGSAFKRMLKFRSNPSEYPNESAS